MIKYLNEFVQVNCMFKNKNIWKYGLISIGLLIIIGCYLWLTCREYCITRLFENKDLILASIWIVIKKIVLVFALFILFKIINYLIDKSLKFFMNHGGTHEKYLTVRKLSSFALWAVFIFFVISIFIGDITVLLASLGLVGFGLTFALQKPILNFVGWLVILFKNLYSEGDRIKINNVVGDVKEIQVMNTIVEGLLESSDVLSGKTISFPNELVLSTDVQNYTKDSNYIVNELKISITYESDYVKAIKLLKGIITVQIENNKAAYKKKMNKHKTKLNSIIGNWTKVKNSKLENKEELIKIEKIKNEKEQLENNLKELEEEFKPLIKIEMRDSAIELVAQFKCPYNEIKKNRTAINLKFLDSIKKEADIEIAYPHLQLVQK